jgi:Holliday junction DNA helicase RuvA
VELADFIVDGNADTQMVDNGMADAILALESLGFKKEHIRKALSGATGDTASLVKQGLKKLQRL